MGIVQRDSFRITIISYIGAAIGYLNKILLFTNFLTTEQVGLANIMITISVIYAQFASMGSYNITLRFFPYFRDQNTHHNGFLFAMTMIMMAGFSLATLAFVMLQKPFALLYKESSPLLLENIWYIIPMALATLVMLSVESYLRSLHKNSAPSIVHELVLRLFITITILLFAMKVISFAGFVALYVAANCLPAIIIIIYTSVIGQLLIRPRFTSKVKRLGTIIIIYGLFSMFNNLSTMLLSSIDSLMVAGKIDLGAAGIYTTMVFITSVLLIPYRSLIKVSGPVVAAYWKARNMKQMQDLYRKATASNMLVGGLLFLVIWVNIDAIFQMMPGQYEAGRFVFLFLGIGKLFDMATGLNGTILATSKKFRYDLLFTVGLVIVAIIGNLIMIPLLGMNGAALASMGTIVAFNLLRLLFINHHYHLQPFLKKDIAVLLLTGAIVVLSTAIKPIGILVADLLIRTAAACMLFLLPLLFLKVSPEINELIKKNLKHIL